MPVFSKEKYRNYIKYSPYWQLVKSKIYARDGGQCLVCKSCERLNCHHISYAFLYRELLALHTVCLLCEWCHNETHKDIVLRNMPYLYSLVRERIKEINDDENL